MGRDSFNVVIFDPRLHLQGQTSVLKFEGSYSSLIIAPNIVLAN